MSSPDTTLDTSLDPSLVTGLYGGTFDPVHLGHLNLARSLLAHGHLEQVLFMPAARSPLKAEAQITGDHHRLAMLRLATGDEPRFHVSDYELRRRGLSYTVVTAAHCAATFGDRLRLVIGMDSLGTLPHWYEARELVGRYRFLIYQRPGVAAPPIDRLVQAFGTAAAERLLASVVPGELSPISATEVRNRLIAGKPVESLLSPAVVEYIRVNHLYNPSKESS